MLGTQRSCAGSGSSNEIGDSQEKQLPALAPTNPAIPSPGAGTLQLLLHAHSPSPNFMDPLTIPLVGLCNPTVASKPECYVQGA